MKLLTTNQLESHVEARTEQLMKVNQGLEQTILEMRQLMEAAEDANRKKSEFLTTISHEIRTPMNGVLGMIQLLAKTSLDNLQKDYVDTIYSSGNLLLNLINDILDFSQIESGELELESSSFNFSEMMEETVAIFAQEAHRKGLELVCIPPSELSRHVLGDANRLRQLLINLISNAVKFTEEGEVVISAELGSSSDDTVALTLSVTDTGVGIPEEVMDWFSDSFSEADDATIPEFDGIGLGLTISKQLVELMGGEMGCESKTAEGSVVSFCLTLSLDSSINPRTEQVSRLQGMRVLIVDDNNTNRSFLEKTLISWGIDCRLCSSGNDALSHLKTAAEQGDFYDLAFVDFTMEEMDGVALATCIHRDERFYNLPLILMSTIYPENVEGYFEAVITKPIRRNTLLSNITSIQDKQLDVKAASVTPEGINKEQKNENKVLSGINVLLVEDNLANQKVALTMLKHLGANVIVASSGEEAVEKFPVCSANVVLMDCQMPGLDGYQATGIIRAMEEENALPRIPIIALTANAMQEDRQLCLDAGMNDYLTKPIEYNLLAQAIINNLSPASYAVEENNEASVVAGQLQNVNSSGVDEISSGLDHVVLSQLKDMCEDVSLYEQIMSIYRVEAKNLMADLNKAYQICDYPLVVRVAHSLKSSSRNVGAIALGQLLENLERRAKKNNLEGADEIHAAIVKEYEVVNELLQS